MFSSQGQCCVVLCQVLKSWNTKQSEQVCSVFQRGKLAETKVHTACPAISDAKFGSSISARCLHTFAAASDHHQDVLGAACEIQSKTVWQIFDAPVVLQLFPHPARPPGCKGWMLCLEHPEFRKEMQAFGVPPTETFQYYCAEFEPAPRLACLYPQRRHCCAVKSSTVA